MQESLHRLYNPDVEEAIETNGVDVGRVKDIDLAKDIARHEASFRKLDSDLTASGSPGFSERQILDSSDNALKLSLASRAVKRAVEDGVAFGVANHAIVKNDTDYVKSVGDHLLNRANWALDDYEAVKDLKEKNED